MARLTEREAWEALADQYGAFEGVPPEGWWLTGLCGWLWRMRIDEVVSAEVEERMVQAIYREVKRTGGGNTFIRPDFYQPGGIAARVAFCRRMAGK